MPAVSARREMAAAAVGLAAAGGLALSTGGQAWLTATVTRPALWRRLTPSAPSSREFSMVRNSTGCSVEAL